MKETVRETITFVICELGLSFCICKVVIDSEMFLKMFMLTRALELIWSNSFILKKSILKPER